MIIWGAFCVKINHGILLVHQLVQNTERVSYELDETKKKQGVVM